MLDAQFEQRIFGGQKETNNLFNGKTGYSEEPVRTS